MKNYFIGIDVSKEKLDATLIHYESQSDSEQQLAYTTVANNPKGFRSLVSWSKKNAGRGVKTDTMLFCCETTGGYDRALCDWLYGNGLNIDVYKRQLLRYAEVNADSLGVTYV